MEDNKEMFYSSSEGTMHKGSLQSGINYFSVQQEDIQDKKELEDMPYRYVGYIQINPGPAKVGTGFLISENHVLTAAHVVTHDKKIFEAKNILYFPHVTKPVKQGQGIEVEKIYVNNMYLKLEDPFNLQYDFAVLKLKQPIGQNKGYFGLMAATDQQLNQLNKITKNQQDDYDNISKVQITGYPQYTNFMRRGSHHVIKYTNEFIYYLIPTMVGQSGGPLFFAKIINEQIQWLVIGIHIFGDLREKFANRITQQKYKQIQDWLKDQDTQIQIEQKRFIQGNQLSIIKEDFIATQGNNHTHGIRCLQVLNQDRIITGEYKSSNDKSHIPKIKMWNFNDKIQQAQDIINIGTCRAFIVDGYLLIYTDENKLRLYDWYENKQIQFRLNNNDQKASEIIADDKIYSINKQSPKLIFFGDYSGNVYSLLINENQQLELDCISKKLNTEKNQHQGGVYCLTHYEKFVISSGKDRKIKIWSETLQQPLKAEIDSQHTLSVQVMDVYQKDKQVLLITGSQDKSVKLFELNLQSEDDNKLIIFLKTFNIFQGILQSLCFVNSEEIAVADGNTLIILNITNEKCLKYPQAHNNQFFICCEPYSNKFFTGGDDNKIYIWKYK